MILKTQKDVGQFMVHLREVAKNDSENLDVLGRELKQLAAEPGQIERITHPFYMTQLLAYGPRVAELSGFTFLSLIEGTLRSSVQETTGEKMPNRTTWEERIDKKNQG